MDRYLIQYPDLAGVPLSGKICLHLHCMFDAGSDSYNLPVQPVDCLTDVEPTICALQPTTTQLGYSNWSGARVSSYVATATPPNHCRAMLLFSH